MEAVSSEVKIRNVLGLHARPSAIFVQTASKFDAEITIQNSNNELVNGKSILGLLMLAAGHGSILKISAIGHDAHKAINTLVTLVENDPEFNEVDKT
jgi:phosphocarrier protein